MKLLRLFSLIVIGAGVLGAVLQHSGWLKVTRIECSFDGGSTSSPGGSTSQPGESCPPQLQAATETLLGQPLVFKDIEAQVLAQDEYETFVLSHLSKQLPGTLKLEFRRLEPTVTLSDGRQEWWISPQGRLKPSPDSGQRVFKLGEDMSLDRPQAEWLRLRTQLLELASVLDRLSLEPRRVVMVNSTTFRLELDGAPPMIGDVTDSWNSAVRMQLLANSIEYRQLDPPVSSIDARFKLPVLKTE